MSLDPSEIDRIVELTHVSLNQLVDWKNRLGEPFHLRCVPLGNGLYDCELDLPQPLKVQSAVPLVHGEFEKSEEEGKGVAYESKPGNTLGQAIGPDGRPAFGIGYDVTTVDGEGRPVLKVYFGTAAAWFVKNEYHTKWNDVRAVREELSPGHRGPANAQEHVPKQDEFADFDDLQDSEGRGRVAGPRFPPPGQSRYRGNRGQGGGGRGGGGGQGGGGGGRRRRGRRGGRGRGGGGRGEGGGGGGPPGPSG